MKKRISICKRIRTSAFLGNWEIREEEYLTKKDMRMFCIFEVCGATIYELVKEWLLNLQPYMILWVKGNKENTVVAVRFVGNEMMFIKLGEDEREKIIVDFSLCAEENGLQDRPAMKKRYSNYKVPFFTDYFCAHVTDTSNYVACVSVPIEFQVMTFDIAGKLVQEGFYALESYVDLETKKKVGLCLDELWRIEDQKKAVSTVSVNRTDVCNENKCLLEISKLLACLYEVKEKERKRDIATILFLYMKNSTLLEWQKKDLQDGLTKHFGTGEYAYSTVLIDYIFRL